MGEPGDTAPPGTQWMTRFRSLRAVLRMALSDDGDEVEELHRLLLDQMEKGHVIVLSELFQGDDDEVVDRLKDFLQRRRRASAERSAALEWSNKLESLVASGLLSTADRDTIRDGLLRLSLQFGSRYVLDTHVRGTDEHIADNLKTTFIPATPGNEERSAALELANKLEALVTSGLLSTADRNTIRDGLLRLASRLGSRYVLDTHVRGTDEHIADNLRATFVPSIAALPRSRSNASTYSEWVARGLAPMHAELLGCPELPAWSASFANIWQLREAALLSLRCHISEVDSERREGQDAYEDIGRLVQTIIQILRDDRNGGIVHINKRRSDLLSPDIAWCGFDREAQNSSLLHHHVLLLIEYKRNLRGHAQNTGLGQLISGSLTAATARKNQPFQLPCVVLDSTSLQAACFQHRPNGLNMTRFVHGRQTLQYAESPENGRCEVATYTTGFKDLVFACYLALQFAINGAAEAVMATRFHEGESVQVQTDSSLHTFEVVEELGEGVCAVRSSAEEGPSTFGTCHLVLKVGPRPEDLATGRRLHLDVMKWSQVEREVKVLLHLGHHAQPGLPTLVAHGTMASLGSGASSAHAALVGAGAIVTPLRGRPLHPSGRSQLPVLQPSALLKLAADVLESLSFLHANGVLHNDVCPENIGIAAGLSTPAAQGKAVTGSGGSELLSSSCSFYLFDLGTASCPALGLENAELLGRRLYSSTRWVMHGSNTPSGDIEALMYTCMALSRREPLPWASAVEDIIQLYNLRSRLMRRPESNPVLQAWPPPLRHVAKEVFARGLLKYDGDDPVAYDKWVRLLREGIRTQVEREEVGAHAPAGEVTASCVL
eukprot:jgi/Chlat1/1463/Chrsp12S02006